MTLTEWYEAEVKPVHEGVYQVEYLFNELFFYAYWNGFCWLSDDENKTKLMWQRRRWRGVIQE